jgi:hypothetical protein
MDINMSEKMSGETTMTELEIDVRGLYEVLKTYRRSFVVPEDDEHIAEAVYHAKGFDDGVTFVREKLGEILGEQSEGGDHA